MFETINRDVLIIFPKQPLYDWANYIYSDEKLPCPEPMTNDEGNIYLIPEFHYPKDAYEHVKESFEVFFKHELTEWTTDENLWPENRTWELF